MRVLGTLVPQALAVTIPMALLIGLLIGLGRLSADRETVAMQACGISIYRLLRPVLLLAMVTWAATLVHHDRGRPDGQSDVSRDRLPHHLGARGERDQAARLLRGLPQPRPLRGRCPGRRRLARVFPGRHVQTRPANRVHGRDLPAGDRSRQAHGGHGAHQGLAPCGDVVRPGEIRGRALCRVDPGPGPQYRLSRHRRPERRQRDDDPRARSSDGRVAGAGAIGARPDDGAAPQVRAALCLHRAGGDRARAGRAARARRQAGGLRARHHRGVSSTT